MRPDRTIGFLITLVLTAPSGLGGQTRAAPEPVVLPRTELRRLHASANGVEYELKIALPDGYDESNARYPVVYTLDSEYSFAITRNILDHLSRRGDIPAAVIVGIGYPGDEGYRRNRTRDYTPTHVPVGGYGPRHQAFSGGGQRFREFLERELVPFIDRLYQTTDRRILVGHSYGGLFASWTALTRPALFQGYIVVSPSLWYDEGLVFSVERQLATMPEADLPVRMYLAVGDREISAEHNMVADLRRFASTLLSRDYRGLRLKWRIERDETHNSVFPGALSDGLRFVLEGR